MQGINSKTDLTTVGGCGEPANRGTEIERYWGIFRIRQERGALKRGGFQVPHFTFYLVLQLAE